MGSVRKALVSDLPAIVEIEKSAGFSGWTFRQLQESLEQHIVFVIEDSKKLCGFAVFNTLIDEVELLNIVILPARQGRGLGKALLVHGLEYFQTLSMQRCFLEVSEHNESAVQLYLLLGFQPMGIRKNYYQLANTTEDAIIMQLELKEMLCKN